MTNRSDAVLAFADFIDNTIRNYNESAAFRAELHAEEPGADGSVRGMCPSWHRHGETPTCYSTHGCRCGGCRAAGSRRQKTQRLRRAMRMWREKEQESA